jgi:hypothetical protein
MLAHYLLTPGGILMIDDIEWTLDFMNRQFVTSFQEWRFFKGVYDLSI